MGTAQSTTKKPMLVRVATEKDGNSLNDLYNEVFNEKRTIAYWRWQFPEGLSDDWNVAYSIAEVDGRIIGQYPTQIRSMCFMGKPVRFVLGLDTVVSDKFRRGYPASKEMFALSCRRAAESGIAIGYGFPNLKHYTVGKRLLGYRDVAHIPELYRRLSWRPAIAKRMPWLPEKLVSLLGRLLCKSGIDNRGVRHEEIVTIDVVDRFPVESDQLWERLKNRRTICTVRDNAFLNWRFSRDEIARYWKLVARNPARIIVGYMVCRTKQVNGDRIGYLADFLYESAPVLSQLLARAIVIFRHEQVDYISVMISPGSAEELSLKHLGFKRKEGFGGQPLIAVNLAGMLPFEKVLDPSHWYLTYADSDLV